MRPERDFLSAAPVNVDVGVETRDGDGLMELRGVGTTVVTGEGICCVGLAISGTISGTMVGAIAGVISGVISEVVWGLESDDMEGAISET